MQYLQCFDVFHSAVGGVFNDAWVCMRDLLMHPSAYQAPGVSPGCCRNAGAPYKELVRQALSSKHTRLSHYKVALSDPYHDISLQAEVSTSQEASSTHARDRPVHLSLLGEGSLL